MRIGYSAVDITPNLGVELSGYGWFLGRRSERVLDRLWARAVAFEDEDKRILLINCDLIAIDKPISDAVRLKLSEEFNIDKGNIMIACTHTHTGPATGRLIGCGEPDKNYNSILPKVLVDAGKLAFKNLKEVQSAKSVVQSIDAIGFNRVTRATAGSDVDNNVRGVVFYVEEGRPIAIVSYGCHPVTLGSIKDISADYPGRVIKALDKEGFDGVFVTGVCGDIDPLTNLKEWGSGTSEVIDEYGKRIARGLIDGVEATKPITDLKLDAFEINLNLKLQEYSNEEIDEKVEFFNTEDNPDFFRVVNIWAKEMKERLLKNPNPYIENMTIQVFRVGSVVLVGLPGEAFTMIGSIIRKPFLDLNILVLGNVNSTMRYIPTKGDIEDKGYAGYRSCFLYLRLPLKPGEGEKMAETISNTLKQRL